jgi:hypothetical protein
MNAIDRRVMRLVGLLIVVCCARAALSEEPQKIDLCQLVADRGTYNHKLVEVEGFISSGFEDFTLFDPSCSSTMDIWLEYGGTARSGTMYCCGVSADRTRPKPLEIEGVTVELIADEKFQQFDRLVHRPQDSMVHATLVGRFFSGQRQELSGGLLPEGYRWSGYGHMGCCSLLAIEKVLAVDPQDRKDLDYGAWPDQPDVDKLECGYQDLIPLEPYRSVIEAQGKAESGDRSWAFSDPQRVASVTLAQLLKTSESAIIGIKQTRKVQGRIVYQWPARAKKGSFYMIVVSRPYWVSFYSADPRRVAWAATAAYKVCE